MSSAIGLRIALGCESRVGKDTFADRVQEIHGGVKIAFAERLYAICNNIQATFGFPVQKDPTLLQRQGTELRAYYGDDVFASRVAEQIVSLAKSNPDVNILVTDLRSPVEYDALVKLGFTTVRVIKPDRVIDRDPNHSTEIGLRNHEFDYVILNDGTMEQYYEQIDAIVSAVMTKSVTTGAGCGLGARSSAGPTTGRAGPGM